MTGKQEEIKNGFILGLTKSGCVMIKEDDKYIYLDIPKDFDNETLITLNTGLYDYTGIKLKVRRVLPKLNNSLG